MFQRAIEILGVRERARSKSIETYQSLAYVISINESRRSEALSILEIALSLKPDMLDLLNMKGYLLHNLNRSSEAVDTLQQVLRANPAHKDSLYHLGIAYSKLGEVDKAEQLLRKVLKLDMTNGRAILHLGLLLAKKEPPTVEGLVEAGK
jgi:tetratricopeptide (TPR) repeat protein